MLLSFNNCQNKKKTLIEVLFCKDILPFTAFCKRLRLYFLVETFLLLIFAINTQFRNLKFIFWLFYINIRTFFSFIYFWLCTIRHCSLCSINNRINACLFSPVNHCPNHMDSSYSETWSYKPRLCISDHSWPFRISYFFVWKPF